MKRKKFNKIKPSSLFSGLKEELIKKAAGLAVALIFILTIFILAKAFLYRSDYFRLRTIEVRSATPEAGIAPSIKYDQLLNYYKGKNVFTVNLKGIVKFFMDAYPDAKEIRALVVLPDKIVVSIRYRWPAAFLKGERNYIIDNEGYVLSGIYGNSVKYLTVIEGVSTRPMERSGRRFTSDNLKSALQLLSQIKKTRFLAKYGVTKIDAVSASNMSFYLAGGTEIRIGSENFKERLKVLEKTIKDPRLVLDKIAYIDLRFQDPVIGPK